MKIIFHQSCSVLNNYPLSIGKLLQTVTVIIIHLTHYLFSDWPKAFSEFSESALGKSSSSRLYYSHVKDTQGHGLSCHIWLRCTISKGNHVNFALFVASWFIYFYTFRNKLLVSTTVETIFFPSRMIKQSLDSVFVISRTFKVLVRVVSLILRLRRITPISTLIFWILQKSHSIIVYK